ncbi:MAG TPA: phosphatase PAP2 family protein [Leucothrix mucor]|nr:phosphatase PAP2 family protein [Leucothrix mucor]
MLKKFPLYIVISLFLAIVAIVALDNNHSLFLSINKAGNTLADEIWILIATLGNKAFTLTLILLVFWHKPRILRAALIAGFIATLISLSMTSLVALLRPPAILDPASFHLIGDRLMTNSFPAESAMGVFAILGSVAFYFQSKRLTFLIFLLSSLVGLSYIMHGVHWPSDILAGAALGWVCAWLGVYLVSANIWRDNNIWNYLSYFIYLLIAAYLFWKGASNTDISWVIKAIAILGALVALWSVVWLKKGGNKEPVSMAGWLS